MDRFPHMRRRLNELAARPRGLAGLQHRWDLVNRHLARICPVRCKRNNRDAVLTLPPMYRVLTFDAVDESAMIVGHLGLIRSDQAIPRSYVGVHRPVNW